MCRPATIAGLPLVSLITKLFFMGNNLPEWLENRPTLSENIDNKNEQPVSSQQNRIENILSSQQENIKLIQSLLKDSCEQLILRSPDSIEIIEKFENFSRTLNIATHFGNSDEDLFPIQIDRINNALQAAINILNGR